MAGYTLIGSSSIIQVLGPKVSVEMVAATITTHPTGITATTLVAQADFDEGTAGTLLTDFADSIEAIISQGKAVGGSGTSSLDASGLQAYAVTFEVAYNPPGAPVGTVTADVDVPVAMLQSGNPFDIVQPLAQAEALIDKAYNNLVALSGGTPAPPPPVAPPSGPGPGSTPEG